MKEVPLGTHRRALPPEAAPRCSSSGCPSAQVTGPNHQPHCRAEGDDDSWDSKTSPDVLSPSFPPRFAPWSASYAVLIPFSNLHASYRRRRPALVNSYKFARFSHAQVQSTLISVIIVFCNAILAFSIYSISKR